MELSSPDERWASNIVGGTVFVAQINRFVFGAILIAMSALSAGPAMAESIFPISIPGECVELAQREGVPVVINSKYEAVKAKVKLARLSSRDPLVAQCRAAVERARVAMQGGQFHQIATSGVTP
jgi:hypothetical protein